MKPTRTSVFRVGSLEPQEPAFEDLERIVTFMDSYAPAGRATRRGSLFASPDLLSHGRWVLGSDRALSHEIFVDPDSVYIYPVEVYESASLDFDLGETELAAEGARKYWASAMTLREWREWSKTAKPSRGSWEVLIPQGGVLSAKPMSNRRIIEGAAEEDARQINWRLEPKRAAKSLIWRKANLQAA